jgi:4a-hydroxytetrahydrobiopterin dehydratase
MEARKVSQEEIAEKLSGWKFISNTIEKKFQFKNFKVAFEFMSKVAEVCEKMNHHPKWTNNYNQLLICLETHDQSAVTELDLELAQKIDLLFEENKA